MFGIGEGSGSGEGSGHHCGSLVLAYIQGVRVHDRLAPRVRNVDGGDDEVVQLLEGSYGYVWIKVWMYGCMDVWMHVWLYVWIQSMYVCMYGCMYTWMD